MKTHFRRCLTCTRLAVFALFFSVLGCVTEGREFSADLNWIKKNVTKQEDVRLVLGEPHSIGNSGGTPMWTYGYYKYRLIGASHTKELTVYWNPDRTVNTFTFKSSFPEDARMTVSSGTPAEPPKR